MNALYFYFLTANLASQTNVYICVFVRIQNGIAIYSMYPFLHLKTKLEPASETSIISFSQKVNPVHSEVFHGLVFFFFHPTNSQILAPSETT